LGLIDQVLDLSKIEAGQVKVTTDVFGLGGFLEEITRLSESLAREKDNVFSMTWGGVPKLIDTDALKVKQILLNLIGNACKFTENGKVTLEVDWQEELSLLLFHVRDTGIGIPEHKRELIFEEFAQESTDTHRLYGGTGLGLSLSSRLAGLLGGRILLESEVNVGSTFTLVLPVMPVSTS
jgi:signal transduction histidine kinase